ncbi:MAG: cyclodeaminase/cyclohydrolase family protein [Planctomycetes bacterium]|nr:cyclodeaminase/cyclohydrolase family protein [Planctomycetota bacterium]
MPLHAALVDLSLTAFSNRLAERTPTPGGGSVAAHLVDVGAALTAMACRFTSGEKFASVEGAMATRVEELERLRGAVRPLVDQDSAAYDAVTAAYKLPKSNDAEKHARTTAIQGALRGALDVPARTLAHALLALRVAAAAAPDVNPNLASDAATGVWCLRSAAEAAFLNVRINAGGLADKAWAAERRSECERDLAEVRRLSDDARGAIDRRLG